ncbi:MAG: HD domain-containing protein [Vulcanimicrobiota bacterium]
MSGGLPIKKHTIKDLVHSYIDFDDRERRLIDSPWCQRLKRVRQNDVSSAVYPSMHGTRFEHSLGAMHLAGLCMQSALESSDDGAVKTFLDCLAIETGSQAGGPAIEELAISLGRLYGLLHDIGHPPFSHLMESCLDFDAIYGSERVASAPDKWLKKWHEFNGREIVQEHLTTEPLTAFVARMMGIEVGNLALRAIKSLIDAVIDADRMDFVLRDGLTSGGEFGHYGQERLVKSFRIYLDRAPNQSIREIFIRPSSDALSAIESLLQERYKIYRWVHFHHRVVMATAFFRYALGRARDLGRIDGRCFRAANHYAPKGTLPEPPPDEPSQNSPYTLLGDSYVESKLEELLGELERGDLEMEYVAGQRLRAALRALLLRERWAVPLWKRLDDYREFGSRLRDELNEQIKTRSLVHEDPLYVLGRYAMESPGGRKFLNEVQHKLNADTGEGWYLVECTAGFKVKGDDKIVAQKSGVLHQLSGRARDGRTAIGLSAVVPALEEAWRQDIFLYAFRVADELGEVDDETWVRIGRKRLASALASVYAELRDDIDPFQESLA